MQSYSRLGTAEYSICRVRSDADNTQAALTRNAFGWHMWDIL
jgi:hypothetical protein